MTYVDRLMNSRAWQNNQAPGQYKLVNTSTEGKEEKKSISGMAQN